jgi:hypothetical protein
MINELKAGHIQRGLSPSLSLNNYSAHPQSLPQSGDQLPDHLCLPSDEQRHRCCRQFSDPAAAGFRTTRPGTWTRGLENGALLTAVILLQVFISIR